MTTQSILFVSHTRLPIVRNAVLSALHKQGMKVTTLFGTGLQPVVDFDELLFERSRNDIILVELCELDGMLDRVQRMILEAERRALSPHGGRKLAAMFSRPGCICRMSLEGGLSAIDLAIVGDIGEYSTMTNLSRESCGAQRTLCVPQITSQSAMIAQEIAALR